MKSRLTNFLLVFGITLLVVQLFLPKAAPTPTTGIVITTGKTEYVVPNIPLIEVGNYTATGISFDTCKDFQIIKDSQPLALSSLPKEFCKTVKVEKEGKAHINLNSVYKLYEQTGNFLYKLKYQEKEYTVSQIQGTPNAIRSFFSNALYAPIFNAFVYIISILPGHNLALAIIILTIIIRLILLVPQHHMLKSQKRLQEIQPKIKEIQEKYKWDQTKLGMELMNIYKTEWVNPVGSCLPLLIQMPILIVLYWVISGITDPSNSYFLYQGLSAFQITSINTKVLEFDLLSKGGIIAIALAVLVGIAQFAQTRLSFAGKEKEVPKKKVVLQKKPGEDGYEPAMPEMPDMSKMMGYSMPLMMAFTTYFFPLGVGLYWLIGTLFMLAQQVVVNMVTKKKK